MASDASQLLRLHNPDGLFKPTALGFSQVAEIKRGKLIVLSGQVGWDADGNLVGTLDLAAQTRQVFENIKRALESSGATFAHVAKLTYYLAEPVDETSIPTVRQVRDQYLNKANPPASTLLVVSRLARPEWLIEIEATAVVES